MTSSEVSKINLSKWASKALPFRSLSVNRGKSKSSYKKHNAESLNPNQPCLSVRWNLTKKKLKPVEKDELKINRNELNHGS